METEFVSQIPRVTKPNAPRLSQSVEDADNAAAQETITDNRHGDDATAPAAEDDKALAELVNDLNQSIQMTTRALRFSIDQKYGRLIVSVVDKETDEVIRQIPPEVALQVADALENATGVLISERA